MMYSHITPLIVCTNHNLSKSSLSDTVHIKAYVYILQLNENKSTVFTEKIFIYQNKKSPFSRTLISNGGPDENRTRDLLRDREAC